MLLSSSSKWAAEVSPIGFGCCPMGGHGWGRVEDRELVQAVETALDLGVNLFDTSDIYGLGASEMLLGHALRGRRDRAVVATKFGVRHQNGRTFYDTSSAWIRTAAEGSLRRLNIDCIDLYQMHYWDGVTPLEDIASTLESLLAAGKIRAYGVTNYDPSDPVWSGRNTRLASYSYQYSLVDRQHETLIDGAQTQSEALFMSWGSLGQGVLSGKYQSVSQLDPTDRRRREAYTNFHGDKFADVQRLVQEMKVLAAEAGFATVAQLALRWIVDRFPRALPLVGIKRPGQIIDAAAVFRLKLEPTICTHLANLTAEYRNVINTE